MQESDKNVSKALTLLPILLLFLALALGAELLLSYTGRGSLCSTDACNVVKEYVRYGNRFLTSTGFLFFLLLSVTVFLSRRPSAKWLETAVGVLFLSGLAFDGGILGFQFFGIKVLCTLCFIVGGALLISYLIYCLGVRSASAAVLGLTVWASAFMCSAVLAIPQRTPPLDLVPFYHFKTAGPEYPKQYLFFKLSCPHCLATIQELALGEPISGNWFLVSLDTDEEEIARLSTFRGETLNNDNLFATLLSAKRIHPTGRTADQKQLEEVISRARTFADNTGYPRVPWLLVQESASRRLIITGDENIRIYLHEHYAH